MIHAKHSSKHLHGAQAARISLIRLRGFTLTELLVTIIILLIMFVAVARIFGTASQVTGVGEALANADTEVSIIERKLRRDIAHLSRDGFFAIRCVAVQNDYNVPLGGPLLKPNLPEDAWIRADQLVFFKTNLGSSQVLARDSGGLLRTQSTASRVYVGHGVHFGRESIPYDTSSSTAIDPLWNGDPLYPWTYEQLWDMGATAISPNPGSISGVAELTTSDTSVATVNGYQPIAPNWLLCYQNVLLADDDGNPAYDDNDKTVLFQPAVGAASMTRSSRTIFNDFNDWALQSGRVDVAATTLADIHRRVTTGQYLPGVNRVDWDQQRDTIARAVYYPRAERIAPSGHRLDEALTHHVIAPNCSSFTIDWTYDDGTGRIHSPNGVTYRGVELRSLATVAGEYEQPWFGLDRLDSLDQRGVLVYIGWWNDMDSTGLAPQTILPINVETLSQPDPAIQVAEYFFGYNQDQPLNPFNGVPDVNMAYTPWPSAIRITMTLHDSDSRLEQGRTVQFTIELPRNEG